MIWGLCIGRISFDEDRCAAMSIGGYPDILNFGGVPTFLHLPQHLRHYKQSVNYLGRRINRCREQCESQTQKLLNEEYWNGEV